MIKDSIQYIKIYLRYMELSESGYYKNKMEELCNKYDIKIKESD
jgi:hypothetical protein